MRILPMGAAAVLVDDPPGGPAAWSLGLRASAPAGVVEIVPAARTVLVSCVSADELSALVPALADVQPAELGDVTHEASIAVTYDGDDLDEVAERTGLRRDEVVAVHAGGVYSVAFCGFAPGFAYLEGLDPRLRLPRRATPRTRVPAGSVAIADRYSAVYPGVSPGGWHLLGRTDATLFDPQADPPTLLRPGMRVRFVPT